VLKKGSFQRKLESSVLVLLQGNLYYLLESMQFVHDVVTHLSVHDVLALVN
jgi:hypothetical protein